MAVEKLSVSLEPELAERARQGAQASGLSLSAFVGEAVEYRLKLEAARHLLADWESENGPITGTERDRVKAKWPV